MAQSGAVRCTATALVYVCVALLLGGEACASAVKSSLSARRTDDTLPQVSTSIKQPPSLVEVSAPSTNNNLGLAAEEALTRVWKQLTSTKGGSVITKEKDVDSLSILDGVDYAATAVNVVEPTMEQFTIDDAALESSAEDFDEAYAATQLTDAPTAGNTAADDAAELWLRAQHVLSWLMGCTHGSALMRSQQELPGPAQLQVIGSSEAMPAAVEGPSGLLQRLTAARPVKATMLLSSNLPGQFAGLLQPQEQAAVPFVAWQKPLMMQRDGVIRPQKLANLLQSLTSAQAASGMLPVEGAAALQPQVLSSQAQASAQPRQIVGALQQLPWNAFGISMRPQTAAGDSMMGSSQMQGFEQPQSIAALLQQLPWLSFGKQLRGELTVPLPEREPAASEEAEVITPSARAAIPGQNGATVVLTNAQPVGQDILEQEDTQSASEGAVDDGTFPSPQSAEAAGMELAQKLGLPLEEALDRVASTVLQQRGGGSPGWAVELQGGEDHESLTELDTLPASEYRQRADDAIWREVTAVPPQAGPDVRQGYLQRLAGFLDQLLGRDARAFSPTNERTAEEVAADVKGPVVLATASGRGPAEVRAYRAEQNRVVEGVSADGYFVEPSLVADDVRPVATVPDQAVAPVTANAHNNAAIALAPVPAPEPDQEPGREATGAAAAAPAAGISPRKGNANAHNNTA